MSGGTLGAEGPPSFNLLLVWSLCSESDGAEWELSEWHSGIAGREALPSPFPLLSLCVFIALSGTTTIGLKILKAGQTRPRSAYRCSVKTPVLAPAPRPRDRFLCSGERTGGKVASLPKY